MFVVEDVQRHEEMLLGTVTTVLAMFVGACLPC